MLADNGEAMSLLLAEIDETLEEYSMVFSGSLAAEQFTQALAAGKNAQKFVLQNSASDKELSASACVHSTLS